MSSSFWEFLGWCFVWCLFLSPQKKGNEKLSPGTVHIPASICTHDREQYPAPSLECASASYDLKVSSFSWAGVWMGCPLFFLLTPYSPILVVCSFYLLRKACCHVR